MRNNYKVKGKETVIFLERINGDILETIIDTEDLCKIKEIDCMWYAKPTRNPERYYVQSGKCSCCGKRRYLHRLIKGAPNGKVVDHLDTNTLNNKKENLEIVTNAENLLRGRIRNNPKQVKSRWNTLAQI